MGVGVFALGSVDGVPASAGPWTRPRAFTPRPEATPSADVLPRICPRYWTLVRCVVPPVPRVRDKLLQARAGQPDCPENERRT